MTEPDSTSLEKSASLPEIPTSSKLAWHDRMSDWFNAILVKETRQALKSRQFLTTFMLLLGISWVVAVFGLLNAGPKLEHGSEGGLFFDWFYVVLAFAVLLIVPFNAYRSLLNERDQETFELLSITALKPRQIVWGKLLSSLIQLFIYFSAITPFIAFSSLLQGFNTVMAAYMLTMTMFLSLLLSMTGLMISTAGKSRASQGFLTFSVLGLLFFVLYSVYALVITQRVFRTIIALNDPNTWWVTLCVLLAGATYFILAQKITVNQLTFESDNRSSGVRLIFSIQFWMFWCGIVGFYSWNRTSPSRSLFFTFVVFSVIHLAVWGLFITTEGDHLSHRVRRSLSKRSIFRFLRFPLMPGGALGYLFILFHFFALGLFVIWLHFHALKSGMSIFTIGNTLGSMTGDHFLLGLLNLQSRSWTPEIRFTAGCILYSIIFLGFATFLARWGSSVSVEIKPSHARVLTCLLITTGVIFPLVVESLQENVNTPGKYSILKITSPHHTLQYLAASGWKANQIPFDWKQPFKTFERVRKSRGLSEFILVILFLLAGLAIFVNLWAIIHSVREVLRPPPNGKPTIKQTKNAPTESTGAT